MCYVWAVRSTQAATEANKAALDEETRRINEGAKTMAAATQDEISSAAKVRTIELSNYLLSSVFTDGGVDSPVTQPTIWRAGHALRRPSPLRSR